MSDLTQEGLDPNVEEIGSGFSVVPAGKYKMVMVKDTIASAKSGNGKVMTVTVQIVEGPEKGNTIDTYLNIKNTSDVAERIGQGMLKRLCTLTNIDYPPKDTTLMYGKPMIGTVKVESFTSNNTGAELQSNKITAFNPVPETPSSHPQPPNNADWDFEAKDIPF